MALNALGDFVFVVFHRPEDRGAPPALLSEQLEIIERPGVDGTAFLKTGLRQRPFQMRSGVDCATFADANQLSKDYHDAIEAVEALPLIWNGHNYSDGGPLYVPLMVETVRIARIAGAIGGLNANPQAWLEVIWTIQPVIG